MIRRWLSADSPLTLVWLWHVAWDGTPLCRCWRSIWCREWHEAARREWDEYGPHRDRYRKEYSQ